MEQYSYYNADGKLIEDKTYYCRPKAEAGYPEGSMMVTGKKIIDGKEYYFEADGRMKK